MMPGWYLDAMIRALRPYEQWRFRRMVARSHRAAARTGAGCVTTMRKDAQP